MKLQFALLASTFIAVFGGTAASQGSPFDLGNPQIVPFPRALDLRAHDFVPEAPAQPTILELMVWGVGPYGDNQPAAGPELTVFKLSNGNWEALPAMSDPFELLRLNAPNRLVGYYDVALADLDDDGDLDLIGAGNGNYSYVLEFDHTLGTFGRFVSPGVEIDVVSEHWWCEAVLTHGDGPVLDCTMVPNCDLVSSFDEGKFPDDEGTLCDRRWAMGVAVGDIDCDGGPDCRTPGDLDAVFVYRDTRTAVFLNDGSGIDTVAGAQPLVEWQKLQAPPDEILAYGAGSTLNPPDQRYFANDEVLATHIAPGVGGRDVKLSDLDHDGDLDCVIMRYGGNGGCPEEEGQGSNTCFINAYRTPVVYENVGLDVDDDGNIDEPFVNPDARTTPYRFWYRLVGPDRNTCGFNAANSIEVADVDGDGWDDVIVPTDDGPVDAMGNFDLRARVYINDQQGHVGDLVSMQDVDKCNPFSPDVTCYEPTLLIGNAGDANHGSSTATVADWTGDVNAEVAIGEATKGGNTTLDKYWFRVGSTFLLFEEFDHVALDPQHPNAGGDETRYIHAIDIDSDGDRDYLETNFFGTESRVFINAVSGTTPP